MIGVQRTVALLALVALAGPGCASAPTRHAPTTPAPVPTIAVAQVPRQVDAMLQNSLTPLLRPARDRIRATSGSRTGLASDGNYEAWLNDVSEAIRMQQALSKKIAKLSQRAHRDLARLAGASNSADIDLAAIARELHAFFMQQPEDVQHTAAAYLQSFYSLEG